MVSTRSILNPIISACISILPLISKTAPRLCSRHSKPKVYLNNHDLTYLALGDSYTIGQSVQSQERYPFQTAALLREMGIPLKDPQYLATTGWTTKELQQAVDRKELAGTFDVVTLLIGVNDQYQQLDTTGYKERFSRLLQKAILLAGKKKNHVVILSIPDYSYTPFVAESQKMKVHTELGWFNAINKRIAANLDITYVDITSISQEVVNDSSLLAYDHLHYSGIEYRKWAELLAAVVKPVLEKGG